jgi:hypothetical protein
MKNHQQNSEFRLAFKTSVRRNQRPSQGTFFCPALPFALLYLALPCPAPCSEIFFSPCPALRAGQGRAYKLILLIKRAFNLLESMWLFSS